MSLYHLMNGVRPMTFFILPMLGKHWNEYPRFRDCFIGDEEHPGYEDCIHIYTRTGGGNREVYSDENEVMMKMPGYVTNWDDSYDSTFASWVFNVPQRWKEDFVKFKEGRLKEFSPEYQAELSRVFPKLKEKFDELFASE